MNPSFIKSTFPWRHRFAALHPPLLGCLQDGRQYKGPWVDNSLLGRCYWHIGLLGMLSLIFGNLWLGDDSVVFCPLTGCSFKIRSTFQVMFCAAGQSFIMYSIDQHSTFMYFPSFLCFRLCPSPRAGWGMHGEGRYEWPDGRAYEGLAESPVVLKP